MFLPAFRRRLGIVFGFSGGLIDNCGEERNTVAIAPYGKGCDDEKAEGKPEFFHIKEPVEASCRKRGHG